MQLQKLDPIFNTGVNVMRPACNFEPRYKVTMLTTEEWTKGPETSAVKRLVWYTDGSRLWRGTGARVYGQTSGRRLIICLGKYATVFQAEIHAILACEYEIHMDVTPEKYISICCNSQAALIALQFGKERPHWYNRAERH